MKSSPSQSEQDRPQSNHDLFANFYNRLVAVHGEEAAESVFWLMARELGGERVTVPSLELLHREIRDAQIRAAFDMGATSRRALCDRYAVSMSTIDRVLQQQSRFGGEG